MVPEQELIISGQKIVFDSWKQNVQLNFLRERLAQGTQKHLEVCLFYSVLFIYLCIISHMNFSQITNINFVRTMNYSPKYLVLSSGQKCRSSTFQGLKRLVQNVSMFMLFFS